MNGLACSIDSYVYFGTVYMVTNTVNGKIYVGQTRGKVSTRWQRHIYDSVRPDSHNYYFPIAIRKYGAKSFSISVLGFATDQKSLDALERLWIILLSSADRRHGYNSTYGANVGMPNEETRKKLSNAGKRRYLNPEERLRTSEGMKRVRSNPEINKKIIESGRIATQSASFRAIQSALNQERWKNPEYRSKVMAATKAALRTPERRAYKSQLIKQKWADPNYRQMMLDARRKTDARH